MVALQQLLSTDIGCDFLCRDPSRVEYAISYAYDTSLQRALLPDPQITRMPSLNGH